MQNFLIIFLFFFFGINQNVYSQCSITVDTANISHIVCPNGGGVGAAQILQANYLQLRLGTMLQTDNFIIYGGGNGMVLSEDTLDAGFYVITSSLGNPYNSSCPTPTPTTPIYSDTFEIKMPIVNIQSNPTQACPNDL